MWVYKPRRQLKVTTCGSKLSIRNEEVFFKKPYKIIYKTPLGKDISRLRINSLSKIGLNCDIGIFSNEQKKILFYIDRYGWVRNSNNAGIAKFCNGWVFDEAISVKFEWNCAQKKMCVSLHNTSKVFKRLVRDLSPDSLHICILIDSPIKIDGQISFPARHM